MINSIKLLVEQIIDYPNKEYIVNYFDNFDIDSLELTYENIHYDLQQLTLKLLEIYNTILNEFTKIINEKNIEKKGLDLVKKYLNSLISSANSHKTFLDSFKYIIFEENDKNVHTFIDNIYTPEVEDKKTIFFKKYLKTNIKLYQAYYDTLYIILIKNSSKVLNSYTNIIYKVLDKYFLNCRKEIYKYQLHKEKEFSKGKNYVEHSKKIIQLMNEKNMKITDLYNDILNNPNNYNIDVKSQIQLKKMNFKNYDTITLHKFNTNDIKDNILKKTFGLCNSELYNILNNSNLPVCYSNKSFYTLYNDIRINLRGNSKSKIKNVVLKLYLDDEIFTYVNTFINSHINYLQDGYLIEFNRDPIELNFIRDAIIDIDFSIDEYKQLDKTITECKNRYILIYCSQVPFNQKAIKKHFKGGHKVSLLIDKKNKELLFFDPFGIDEYIIYSNQENMNTSMIYILLALELSKNLMALNGYKFLYDDISIYPQIYEYPFAKMSKLYNFNIRQVITGSNKKLRDWAGGYCGLWNYLYIFLLVINPHLDLQDIYSFFYKITNLDYSSMFVKLLIRNFAYYIENALITPNYVIPLTKLDMKQFDDTNVKRVMFNSNELQLSEMKDEYYYRENSNNQISNKVENEIEIDTFIEEHTNLMSIFKDYKVAKNIYAIVKDFSTYIFAKGGLALYAPDKVNFIKV